MFCFPTPRLFFVAFPFCPILTPSSLTSNKRQLFYRYKKYRCFQRKDVLKEAVPKQVLQDSPLQFLSLLYHFFILFQHILCSLLSSLSSFSSTSLFLLFSISFFSSQIHPLLISLTFPPYVLFVEISGFSSCSETCVSMKFISSLQTHFTVIC